MSSIRVHLFGKVKSTTKSMASSPWLTTFSTLEIMLDSSSLKLDFVNFVDISPNRTNGILSFCSGFGFFCEKVSWLLIRKINKQA